VLHFAALVQCAIFLLCNISFVQYFFCAIFLLCYFGLCISVTLCRIAWFSVQCFFCAILVCLFLLHYAVLHGSVCNISFVLFWVTSVFLLHYAVVLHGSVCNVSFVLFWFVYFCYTMPYCMVQCAIFLLCYSNSLYFVVLICVTLCCIDSVCNISFVLFWFMYFCYTMPYCMVQCAMFLLCYFGLCISVTLCHIAWFQRAMFVLCYFGFYRLNT
jgi:hypothetical protein